jgi:DNA-binding Xre family transcriptional regulator
MPKVIPLRSGSMPLTITVLGKIAKALGVEPGDLLRRRSFRKG